MCPFFQVCPICSFIIVHNIIFCFLCVLFLFYFCGVGCGFSSFIYFYYYFFLVCILPFCVACGLSLFHHKGFSLCEWALVHAYFLLRNMCSREIGLQSVQSLGSAAVACGPQSTWALQLWCVCRSMVCGLLVSLSGIRPAFPAMARGFLTTGPPGKYLISYFAYQCPLPSLFGESGLNVCFLFFFFPILFTFSKKQLFTDFFHFFNSLFYLF